jgi:hypothetical protein
MITTLEAVDGVFGILQASLLSSAISGKIYKHRRPLGSQQEDVVIGALPITGDQLQRGVLNVNLHVPGLKISTPVGQDLQPDNVRMKELAGIAVGVLTDVWKDDYHFTVQQQTLIADGEDFYINIRINFFNVNLN